MVALEIFRVKISIMNQLEIASVDSLLDFIKELSHPRKWQTNFFLRPDSTWRKKKSEPRLSALEDFWMPNSSKKLNPFHWLQFSLTLSSHFSLDWATSESHDLPPLDLVTLHAIPESCSEISNPACSKHNPGKLVGTWALAQPVRFEIGATSLSRGSWHQHTQWLWELK